jgi:hypothetical protein
VEPPVVEQISTAPLSFNQCKEKRNTMEKTNGNCLGFADSRYTPCPLLANSPIYQFFFTTSQ